jgi:N-acetylmuramoyl-L-alanine amidase
MTVHELRPCLRLSAALGLLGALILAAPATAQRATVEISADVSAANTRLVLTHSRPVTYDIERSGRRVEIVFTEAVEAIPAESRLDDPILQGYRLEDDHRLVLQTGPGFRSLETFELRNPHRLVIDLLGTRPGGTAPTAVEPRRDPQKKVIVIDPGHGGFETGAVGPTGLQEKEITLDLAQRLKSALSRDPSLEVVLTREEDRLVGLDERTAIANHNRAVLFLSIHLNAARRANARGAETYFLSTDATDDEARTLAALENRAYGVEEQKIPEASSEGNGLDLVLWDLAQNQYLAESSLLAESMQAHLNRLAGTPDRGVRQAPFRVLMGATMPAILVEVGFVSNPEEERLFRSMGYRNQVVSAMAGAVYEFLERLEQFSPPATRPGGAGAGPE